MFMCCFIYWHKMSMESSFIFITMLIIKTEWLTIIAKEMTNVSLVEFKTG